MPVVYATPFNTVTRLATGASVPCGFDSVDEAVALMGEPDARGGRWATYADTVYTDFVLDHTDAGVNNEETRANQ